MYFSRKIIFRIVILILNSIETTKTWDLTALGLNNSEITVKHITVMKTKSYLSIPRQSYDQNVTLVEALWPENPGGARNKLKIFPSKELQTLGNCSCLQSVISTEADSLGRLFILDSGLGVCSPKIVIYDVSTNRMISVSELRGVLGINLNTIVVDSFGVGGPRAYIGELENEGLIVYSIRDHHWWFVKLSLPTEELDYPLDIQNIAPQQMTIAKNKPLLYITNDETDRLYSVNVALLRALHAPAKEFRDSIRYSTAEIEAKLVGEKLGPSKGLTSDRRGGLYYYIPRDYVLVRWDTHHEITAEHHEILLQSESVLPNTEQIFLDVYNRVWVLLGLPNDEGKHCIQIKEKSNAII